MFWYAFKDFGWVDLFHYALFAVHHLFCVGNGATEYFTNGLVTEAYAEDWEFAFAFAQEVFVYPLRKKDIFALFW